MTSAAPASPASAATVARDHAPLLERPGELIVGTNVPYASTHQRGNRSRNIPARTFLPGDEFPVPQVWWDRWLRIANRALVVSIEVLFRQGR